MEELRYIIDISRHGLENEEFMSVFRDLEARLKNKDGPGHSYKPLNLSKGLDYMKEYPEIALKLNKHIVYHKSKLDDDNSEKILIRPKITPHPTQCKHSMTSLVKSIEKIVLTASDEETKKKVMKNLRN